MRSGAHTFTPNLQPAIALHPCAIQVNANSLLCYFKLARDNDSADDAFVWPWQQNGTINTFFDII
jgi:hypothetical protein